MISQNDNDVALPVLRKYDSKCELILDASHKVKLYNYDKTKNAWVIKDESEGALYLVKRYIPPLYKFIILSKYNKPGSHLCATEIPLSQYLISQTNQTFYMFKNEFGIIQAIFFPNKPDCERFCIKVERIINELKATEPEKSIDLTPIAAKPRFVESIEGILSNNAVPNTSPNGKDKILSMLESARHRYEDGHVEKWSRQIDIKELFQSTTSVNQNASTPSTIDKTPQYVHVPPQMAHVLMHEIDPSQTKYHKLAPTASHPCVMPDKLDQFTVSSDTVTHAAPSSSAAVATTYRNGPHTLTVAELEKYLVQNASSLSPNQKKTVDAATVTGTVDDDDDDDDSQLLGPNRFESRETPLNKDQLRDALIYLLQNDNDGSFVSRIHSAYLQSLSRSSSLRK